MIFFIRFIIAAYLYFLIGKANIWLNPFNSSLLVFGSRFFMVLAPLLYYIAKKSAISVALLICAIGSILMCFNQNYWDFAGILLISMGMSIAGYLIRVEAADTPTGAAHNKIAVNLGSVASGILLILAIGQKDLFFISNSLILGLITIITLYKTGSSKQVVIKPKTQITLRRNCGWALLGIAIGIKMYSLFSLLPQYLIFYSGNLPAWYGIMVFVNGVIIILFQLPIMHKLAKHQENNYALKTTLVIVFAGMLLICALRFSIFASFIFALIWVIILSLIECIISYLDVKGAEMNCLFIKELFIGVGGGLCVLLSRIIPVYSSSLIIGSIGIASMIMAILFLKNDLFTIK